MKVLFICSGNSENGISSTIYNQGESLKSVGVQVEYFLIIGKGVFGYFQNIFKIYKFLKKKKFDVIHAHYSLSAITASIAFARPLVVSLMGSDVQSKGVFKFLILLFSKYYWRETIVKSEYMAETMGIKNCNVLPNGVDLIKYKPLNKTECKIKHNFDLKKKHIVFIGNPERKEKNYNLARSAVNLLNGNDRIEFHVLYNIENKFMNEYMNAADVLLLTSLWEGSPNAIKEAMAVNCPAISTNVGDVKWLFTDSYGYYITGFNPKEIAEKLNFVLFSVDNQKVNGRDRIIQLEISSEKVAEKLLQIYKGK